MASQALPQAWAVRRRPRISGGRRPGGTPELYFDKQIDNSRLRKVADRERNREMAMFTVSLCALFLVVMVYAWQHFSAVEYGYRIEAQKSQLEGLQEVNRELRLDVASLRAPERIDAMARRMGLGSTVPGQVQQFEGERPESAAPVLARAQFTVVAPPQ